MKKENISSKAHIPEGFSHPTALPRSSNEEKKWQDANKTWWERNPMRYDWKKSIPHKEFTKDFYNEIDLRFFSDAKTYMPWKKIPFDNLIDFHFLHNKNVLEIGMGNGSHAQLFVQYARTFTGIDITDYSVKSVLRRMNCFNLKAHIIQMDAENLAFDDNSFDFIWSWGVIHHSSNPRNIIQEMHRVLRPGGQAVTMVYHRNFWNYYVINGLFRGIFQGDLFRTRSLHKTVQHHADGAMARYYTISEWESLVSDFFLLVKILVYGSKTDIVPLPSGKLKKVAMYFFPDMLSRFITNRLKMGSFLVSVLRKN